MTASRPVVLLTGTAHEHRVVATALAEGPGLDAIVLVEPEPVPSRIRLGRMHRRYGTWGLARRLAFRGAMRLSGEAARQQADLVRVLGSPAFPAGVRTETVPSPNHKVTIDLLERLRPEILCVYGTAIVRDATLATATGVALNLHTGISPRYRGADCTFWPLHRGEPHQVGSTVHVCTSEIDGGAIFGTVRARLEPEDGVGAVFARAVVDGAALYARVVADLLEGTSTPRTQDLRAGTVFSIAMRTACAEFHVWRKMRAGLVRDYATAGCPETWPLPRR